MKSRFTILTIIALAALFTGACTSGSYITSSYTDDVYFNPADVPPPIVAEEIQPAEKSAHRMIISNIESDNQGSATMNNYIFDGSKRDADALVYSMDSYDLYSSDTTVYYNDDDVKYVINNYYDGDAIDYTYRIRRFHRPYFYDSFYWDSWYYDPFYYDPFYYSSWYYPSYRWSWGWNWYSPYYSWYSPYYSSWYSPYYSYAWGYPYSYYGWGSGYPGSYWYGNSWNYDSENYRYGQRRSTSTSVLSGNESGRRAPSSTIRSSAGTTGNVRENPGFQAGASNRRGSTATGVTGESATRGAATNGNVVSERRRTTTSDAGQAVRSTGNVHSVANSNTGTAATRTYTRPATKSSTITQGSSPQSTGTSTSTPQSSSTYNRTYRANSTYNKSSGTSGSGSNRTYRTPSTSTTRSGGSTYSAPSGSSSRSSGSSSSGSSGSVRSSGGSSGYSSPSGSGGGGSRSSSSSGRR